MIQAQKASMKNMRVLKNNQAQALTEFATFASVFLFMLGVLISYGMSYNTQQEFDMETYRLSYQMAGSDAYAPFVRDANLMQLQDRLTVAPAPYPSATRSQYTSSAATTWNQGVLSEPIPYYDTNIPIVDYRLNNQAFNFTTADYGVYTCSEGGCSNDVKYLRIKTTSLNLNTEGTYWRYVFIDAYAPESSGANVEVIEEEDNGFSVFRVDLKYDLDGDGEMDMVTEGAFYTEAEVHSYVETGTPDYKPMSIILVDVDYDPDTGVLIRDRMGAYYVLDPFSGQIDLTSDIYYPQGITPEFSRSFNEDELSTVRRETPEEIISDSKSKIQELIHRRIRLNNQYRDGQPHPEAYIDTDGEYYLDVDYQDERNYNWTWQVPWK